MLSIDTWFSAVAILKRTPFYLHFGRNFDPIVSKKAIFSWFLDFSRSKFKVKMRSLKKFSLDACPLLDEPYRLHLLSFKSLSTFLWLFFVTKSWFCWNFMNLLKLYHFDLFKCHWYLCWCIPQGINCSNMYHWWYFRAVIFTNWPLFNQNKLKITYFLSLFLIWNALIRFNIYNRYVIITPLSPDIIQYTELPFRDMSFMTLALWISFNLCSFIDWC